MSLRLSVNEKLACVIQYTSSLKNWLFNTLNIRKNSENLPFRPHKNRTSDHFFFFTNLLCTNYVFYILISTVQSIYSYNYCVGVPDCIHLTLEVLNSWSIHWRYFRHFDMHFLVENKRTILVCYTKLLHTSDNNIYHSTFLALT